MWTVNAGANEKVPMICENWYEAYAFCIWDGGLLPSEAEWDYAASGGTEQRVYPWSNPPSSTTIDCSYANYYSFTEGGDYCVGPGVGRVNEVGSEAPKGDGKYGHVDIGGNALEWNLDWDAPYVTPCDDCAHLPATATKRAGRGGASVTHSYSVQTSDRQYAFDPAVRGAYIGIRCARTP